MSNLDLKRLKEQSDRNYESLKERKRQAYRLARQLGFSPKEAQILSGYSQARIIDLAKQRGSDAQ